MKKSRSVSEKEQIQLAAQAMGKYAWKVRLKRYGLKKLKKQLSLAGRIAARMGVSGRPRMPDDKVKPNTLYQREHRAQLKAKSAVRKGGK